MSNENKPSESYLDFVAILSIICIIWSIFSIIWIPLQNFEWKYEAISKGNAYYSPATGEFTWRTNRAGIEESLSIK